MAGKGVVSIRWFPVGPYRHEAVHGPYTARMCHEERGWSRMPVFRDGVHERTISSSPASLRRQFAEIVERYELERDRERLDFLDTQEHLTCRTGRGLCIVVLSGGVRFEGEHWRQAIDAARGENREGV